ncbi:MAG TPA: carbohydrate ABC transporter permease [Gaiellaceae bacterium]|jgi:glucose/mannose transport system permease protein|nr:carbohydrate ABC transporter permease [Gaiellaceae bacterium]
MRPSRILIYGALVLLALFFLLPIYVLVMTSVKTFAEADLSRMWDLPNGISFSGIDKAWTALSPNFVNSIYLVIPATLVTALIGSINGYVLAKWRFRGANVVFPLLLFGMFIPYQSILIPLVRFLQEVNLYGTIKGLVLVHIVYGIPIATLIFRNYYAGVPDDLAEAAKVEGASLIDIYRRVFLPLSLPGFAVVCIWEFTQVWNDFLFAVTVTPNPSSQPVTVAVQNLSGSQIVEWNAQMAGALIAALPTLLVYIFLGRFFLRGLLAGALK